MLFRSVGISGLELKYHDLLIGVDGRIVREVNSSGKSIAAGSGEVLEPKTAPVYNAQHAHAMLSSRLCSLHA